MLRRGAPDGLAALFYAPGQRPHQRRVMIFAMLPGLLFGLYKKHGQPLEAVIGQIVRNRFTMPKARARPERIETDPLGYFKMTGAAARVLDGAERLEVLHGVFHPGGELFRFDWKWLPASGLCTKDFIALSSLRFGSSRVFGMSGKYGAVSFLQIPAPDLSDEMPTNFLNRSNGVVVNLHVQALSRPRLSSG